MKKVYTPFIFIVLIFASIHLPAQKNEYGNHFITNFTKEDYGSGPQNYSVVQDNRGVVYFGNQGEILEYDGKTWRKISIPNNSFVRALAQSDDGVIYAGATGEFGYLKPDKTGELQYHSLSENIDSSFQIINHIYTNKDLIYFTSKKYIFKFQNDSLVSIISANISDSHFWDFLIDSTLYISNYQKGLLKLEDNNIVTAEGGEFYQNNDILALLPYKKSKLLVVTQDKDFLKKFYIYDRETGESEGLNKLEEEFKNLDTYNKPVGIYGGIRLHDGNYLINTLYNGLIIVNSETWEIEYHYTDKNGLIDNTVIDAAQTKDGHIWMGLNTGISKIEYNSPIKRYGRESGLKSIKVDVVRFQEKVYVATNLQVYQQLFDEHELPYFKQIPNISQGRDFLIYTEPNTSRQRLLLATYQGIFDLTSPDNAYNINTALEDRIFGTNGIIQSEYHKGLIFGAYEGGLVSFKYENGKWQYVGEDRDIEENLHNLVEVNDSVMWASTEVNGLMKIIFHPNSFQSNSNYIENIETLRYDTSKGLPSNDNNKIFQIDEEIFFLTENGFYRYNESQDAFEPDTSFFHGKYNNLNVLRIAKYEEDSYFIQYRDKNDIEKIDKIIRKDDTIEVIHVPFQRISGTSMQGLFNEDNEYTWIVTGKDLYSYDNTYNREYQQKYHALIRSASLSYDSVIFKGTYFDDTSHFNISLSQPDILNYDLDYKHNNISFTFTSPYFEDPENLVYSFKLQGYDKEWSNWATKADKEYTNLDAGRYTFMVKAKNVYGVESEPATYSFAVLPPWYQTIWAYFVYVILAVLLVIAIVKWYTRRLEQEKIRLEKIVQERTKEVVAQKDQIEQQRDEIAKKNRDITDSIEYASKIQNAVLPGEDFTQKVLPEHFVFFRPRDIVSGDFYWIDKKNGLLIIIAADCTGHGVPGAFMSMLGVSLLNEIVNKHETTQANQILNELRDEVKRTLRQTGKEGEAKDGMDIALSVVDLNNMKMQYAGAYNPLYLFRNGELYQYKADRMPIGIYIREKPTFTNHDIELQEGDTFYVFSDGFQDQFGGDDGSKFKTKRLKDVLADIQDKSMAEQKEILEKTFDDWKGEHEQLDDVILIGVRI